MKKQIIFSIIILLAFFTNAQVHVNSAGDMGIGSSTPSARLDIRDADDIETKLLGTGDYSSKYWAANYNFGYAFGIDNASMGHIYKDLNNPQFMMSFNKYGSVSIGTSAYQWSNYKLYVYGKARATQYWENGDYSTKNNKFENIEEGNISKLMRLNGVKYELKEDSTTQLTYCFIPQELQVVYPELVKYDDNDESIAINYTRMIPVLVEAIKEQQEEIESLKEQLAFNEISDENFSSFASEKSVLMQNVPNPFKNDTRIDFVVAENATNAKLIIHDMQGTEIKVYDVSERGNTSRIIKGRQLKAGMYMFTLIVDEKIIDSKRMVLTSN